MSESPRSRGALDLGAAPADGSVHEWAEQRYVVSHSVSLVLRDGTPYAEITWATNCPDCAKAVTFKTGLRKRYFPKRCKACNGPDDLDAIERRVYTKKRWSASVAEKRAEKAAAACPEKEASVTGAKLGWHDVMSCVLHVGGRSIEFGWKPGEDLSGEPEEVQAAEPVLAAEYNRLLTAALLG